MTTPWMTVACTTLVILATTGCAAGHEQHERSARITPCSISEHVLEKLDVPFGPNGVTWPALRKLAELESRAADQESVLRSANAAHISQLERKSSIDNHRAAVAALRAHQGRISESQAQSTLTVVSRDASALDRACGLWAGYGPAPILHAVAPGDPESQGRFPLVKGKVALYLDNVPTHLVAGRGGFTVELVIANGLGRSFSLPDACNGWLLVNLALGSKVFEPGNGAVGCAPVKVPVGTTRVRREVGTTYDTCSQGSPSATMPLCVGHSHDGIPSLPPGDYTLEPDTTDVPNPTVPDPVSITLEKS